MYVKRVLEDRLRKYLRAPEILAVIGPRQCGKTTLLREIFSTLRNAVFIDFEDRDVLDLFNNDIKGFYSLHVKGADYLFIDEFQYADSGGQKLKYLYDTHKIKVIISGSSVPDLTRQAVKYLVGRIFTFNLSAFSFSEFLSYRNPSLYKNIYLDAAAKTAQYIYGKRKTPPVLSEHIVREILPFYHEYAIYGGYPRVVLTDDMEEKRVVLKNIYNTYLLREIRDILQLSTENELQKLVKALSLQIGSTVAYNELAQISSLDYSRLIRHLDILEKTFIIKRIPPFFRNKRTEIAKAPKVYFWDNGFRNTIISNFQPLDERIDRGSLNENFAASQFFIKGEDIKYWRTKSKAEVDFVVEKAGLYMAIEVKSTLNSEKTGRALRSFRDKYPVHRTVILSENYFSYNRQSGVLFLPLFLI